MVVTVGMWWVRWWGRSIPDRYRKKCLPSPRHHQILPFPESPCVRAFVYLPGEEARTFKFLEGGCFGGDGGDTAPERGVFPIYKPNVPSPLTPPPWW